MLYQIYDYFGVTSSDVSTSDLVIPSTIITVALILSLAAVVCCFVFALMNRVGRR